MFDSPVDQYAPSALERHGIARHGLVHFHTTAPFAAGSAQANRRDVRLVTNGGKVFYPFAGINMPYTISVHLARLMRSNVYRHPLAEMHAEDEDGNDWSGYAIVYDVTPPLFLSGMKTLFRSMGPFTPDDNGMAIYARSSGSCYRLVTSWPNGGDYQTGVATATGSYQSGQVTARSPNGRFYIIAQRPRWDDPRGGVANINRVSLTGSWPEVNAHGDSVPAGNEYNNHYVSNSQIRTLSPDGGFPLAGVCIHPEPSASFNVKETLTTNHSAPDEQLSEITYTTLVDAVVDNSGSVDSVKLTVFNRKTRSRSVGMSGSVTVVAGDASQCATSQTPDGWVYYDGTSRSYTATESIVGTGDTTITLAGYGGSSSYNQTSLGTFNSVTNVVTGRGTLQANVNETTAVDTKELSITFDGVVVQHGVTKPNIESAYGKEIGGFDVMQVSPADLIENIWLIGAGNSLYDGSTVALVKVFLHWYSGDMVALACYTATGTISQVAGADIFTATSKSLRIGGVFAHGSFTSGSYVTEEVSKELFGASNPKTGEIVRDMIYPVAYV